jgi:sortase A
LKKNENANYQNWISQFFFDVSDQNIIGMDTDVSGNGLTNFEKYLLNLNPKMYDTLGTGVSDGQSIIDGRNPWTGKDMTERQKTIAEAYFDKELISNRIAAAQANRNNLTFAPYVSNNSPYYQPGVSNVNNGNQSFERVAFSSPRANADNSSNGEVAGATVNTNPAPTQNNTVNRAPARTAPATGVNSEQIGSLGINTNVPGRVDIPSLKVSVPIVWTKDPKNFERDLKSGVVHYPGTPLPGDIGTSYISGHSSGYFYDKSAYKQAFAKLGNLKDGEKFTITVTLKNGKKATLHYKVGGRATYAADDQRQFVQTADQVVALSTCWPINTTAERLVVYGTLTQIEK